MKKFIAVVNEELIMIKEAVVVEAMEEFGDAINKIAEAITKKVTEDQRFIDAVGEENAKKTCFHLLPICSVCEECDSMDYELQVMMTVDEEETDFNYGYDLLNPGDSDDLSDATSVVYNNGGKSQLMKVFENFSNGVTSTKTFENVHGATADEITVEKIFEEILSEGDLVIY